MTKAKVDSTLGIRIELQSAERKELRKALRAHATAEQLKAVSSLVGPIAIGGGIAGGAMGAVYIWKHADNFIDEWLDKWADRTRALRMREYIASQSTMAFDDWLEVRNSWRFRIFRTYSAEDEARGFKSASGIARAGP